MHRSSRLYTFKRSKFDKDTHFVDGGLELFRIEERIRCEDTLEQQTTVIIIIIINVDV